LKSLFIFQPIILEKAYFISIIVLGDLMNYIRRNDDGVLIKDENHEYSLKIGIKNHINNLCMENLSTFDGRKKAVIKYLNQKNNIPIYVDDKVFLYPTKSIREYDMIFINYYSVLSFRKIDSTSTLFIFNNLDELVVNVSIKKVIKQHQRIENIIEKFGNIG